MPLRALTLDMWGTILWPRDHEAKAARRLDLLERTLRRLGHAIDRQVIDAAWRATAHEADRQFRQSCIDQGPSARWALLERKLELPPGTLPVPELMAAYDEITLEFLPSLMPGLREVLDKLRRHYALAVICNTGFAPGSTIRQMLERHGLLDAFQVLTFSNEFGRLKPDPAIFHHTLRELGVSTGEAAHVGDLEELDVDGAHAAGLPAARYDYAEHLPKPPSRAEVIFTDWREFPGLLSRLEAPA